MRNSLSLIIGGALIVVVLAASAPQGPSFNPPGPPPFAVKVISTAPLQPFQATQTLEMPSTINFANGVVTSVPPGKMFVIEYVTFWATGPASQELAVVRLALSNPGGARINHNLAARRTTSGVTGFSQWGYSEDVRLYAAGEIRVLSQRGGAQSPPTGKFFITVTLSGHLVDQ